jgi:predicted RNA-binding protein with PUA-like domain
MGRRAQLSGAQFYAEMALGDRSFCYHSQKQKAIIGVVEVIALAHPDVTSDDLCWEFLDIKAFSVVDPPATLAQIKHDPRLSAMMLVKNPRLSVQPVSAAHWRIIGSLTPNSSL